MQNTSETYRRLLANPNHRYECTLTVGERGLLVDNMGDYIVFGSGANAVRLLIDTGGAEGGFSETQLISMRLTQTLFSEDVPTCGCAVSAELEVEMIAPLTDVPRAARVVPYIRVTDGFETSEWVQQGVFFIDTREKEHNPYGEEVLKFHAFDLMVTADVDFPSISSHDFPAQDTQILQDIANYLHLAVDERTWEIMTDGYEYGLPVGYSCREILQQIAASYVGNFIINESGELRLVQLNELPSETNLLIDNDGYQITWADHWDLTWNQYIRNPEMDNGNHWGADRCNRTLSDNECHFVATSQGGNIFQFQWDLVAGHKYYVSAWVNSNGADVRLGIGHTTEFASEGVHINATTGSLVRLHTVGEYRPISTATGDPRFLVADYYGSGTEIIVANPILCDLTRMFGAGNEPTADVFAQMFPDDYYDNDAGTSITYDGEVRLSV